VSARATERSLDVTVQHLMIPTRDGTRLSANVFRPVTDPPVPCVVEYTPYRKDDLRGAARDFGSFYFAERGVAAVQLDVRGTGDSDGFVTDEYQYPQEQLDGFDALEWLAGQPWCNGRTGLWGTSYAGFTALQVAQFQPPSLGAIAPVYATDDRYTDDMHFRGGALNGWSVIGSYALGMVARNALPPYPELSEDWKAVWDLRLERNEPWLIRWIEGQLDGPYWRSTLGRMYDRVQVPTLIIGGWADFYVNASLRWMHHLRVPKKLIMGPWPHTPPDAATPGPRIDFLYEITRWWKHWLDDEAGDVMDEPPITVFIQTYRRPDAPADLAPGFWRFEQALPPPRMHERSWFLGTNTLSDGPPTRDHAARCEHAPYVGFADLRVGSSWGDQSANERLSVVYTSEPLTQDIEILGFPRIVLYASATAETAFVAGRLCDVAPDGASTLVSKGILNATRRNGMDRAEPLVPGEIYSLALELDAISWIFPRGHRIRLAISGADFPEVWPAPSAAELQVYSGPSQPSMLILPVVPAEEVSSKPSLRPPAPRRSQFKHTVEPAKTAVSHDTSSRSVTARRELKETIRHPDGTTTITSEHRTEMRVSAANPAEVLATGWDRKTMRRPGLDVENTAVAELRSDATSFFLELTLEIRLNHSLHRQRRWTKTIPRLLL
jgi:putative CocE/NonD family hydrolase